MGTLQCFVLLSAFFGIACGNTIVGAGTSLPAQVFADAQFAYRFTNDNFQLQYFAVESQSGVCRIESAANECDPSDTRAPNGLDFASSIVALKQSDYDKYPDLQMYPVLATAIVPVYNLNCVQGLTLSTTVLAQIFSGQISTWDDSRIRTLNPNFTSWKVPPNQSIEVVVRQESYNGITMAFKTALSDFSRTYSNYVEVSPRPSWGNMTPTKIKGSEALLTYVLQTPWTISYAVLKHAVAANATQVLISKSGGAVVRASVDSTTFAVLERGSRFGRRSNGHLLNVTQWDATRLVADINNARGDNAWPIVAYTYIVLRKSTLRSGATCSDVHETVAFWYWFLTVSVIGSIARDNYFASPRMRCAPSWFAGTPPSPEVPEAQRDCPGWVVVPLRSFSSLQRLITDVTCNGQPVFRAALSLPMMAAGQASVGQALRQLAAVYTINLPQVSFSYASTVLNTSNAVAAALGANQFVAVRQPGLAPASGAATLLFAGVALVVVSQYDLVLDVPTLVRILEGDIQTWLHPDLMALNPNGIRSSTGGNITNSSQPIVLFNGPTFDRMFALMRSFSPGFMGQALRDVPLFDTEDQLRLMVAGVPFSLAMTLSNGQFSPLVKLASLWRSGGVVVAPTPTSIRACTASATYSAAGWLDLSTASDPACYPLTDLVYLVVRIPQCDRAQVQSVDSQAAGFLVWVFRESGVAASMESEGLAVLANVTPAVQQRNVVSLSSLFCKKDAKDSMAHIVPVVVGACVGAVFLIAIPAAWYVWKSTRDMRALKKRFSDVKVAEDCAEAIACFDLEGVSWLSTLTKPSKIQLAFLRIINLLVEVKPFIPDQLLAQLQAARKGAEEPRADDPRPSRRYSGDDATVAMSQSHSSLHSSVTSRPNSAHTGHDSTKLSDVKSGTGSSARRPGRAARVAPSLPGSVHSNQSVDRLRRTCTYMYVRFVSRGDAEDDQSGQRATAVAAHVVTVAKGHGATIDKVTYDSVALHWNVAVPCASAPLKATALALELACTAQILPPEAQADLRLLIGIGHGPCTVATVSAAGQRFFVVGGPEVSNAVEVVVRELAVPVGCTVLLSNAVQQEIKYGFRCSLRLWYRDVLFWEPVEQRDGCKTDDEWMYQIQRMDRDDTALDVGRALQEVFLLARTGQLLGVLQREVRRLQDTYAADLSPQDLASLRLLQNAPPHCSDGFHVSTP